MGVGCTKIKRIYKMELVKLYDVINKENVEETIDWLSGMYVVNKEFMDMVMQTIEKQQKKIKEQGDIIKQLQEMVNWHEHKLRRRG
jgi:uncharacterized phage infection (PIP) family protein YhgE